MEHTQDPAPAVPAHRPQGWKSYAAELVMVFVGVLSAFLISDWRQTQLEERKRADLLFVVYQDFDRFVAAGDTANPQGFLRFFDGVSTQIDSFAVQGTFPPGFRLQGDYWQIEVIASLLRSGQLNQLDAPLFLNIARFHSIHANFLESIERFNEFYASQIFPMAGQPVNRADVQTRNRLELLQRYAGSIRFQAGIVVESARSARSFLARDPRIAERLAPR